MENPYKPGGPMAPAALGITGGAGDVGRTATPLHHLDSATADLAANVNELIVAAERFFGPVAHNDGKVTGYDTPTQPGNPSVMDGIGAAAETVRRANRRLYDVTETIRRVLP